MLVLLGWMVCQKRLSIRTAKVMMCSPIGSISFFCETISLGRKTYEHSMLRLSKRGIKLANGLAGSK